MSVGLHLVTNGGDTEGLFHAAIMQSGTVLQNRDIADDESQAIYDDFVYRAGCSGANDTLTCLRELPYKEFYDVMNSTYGAFTFKVCGYLTCRPCVVILICAEVSKPGLLASDRWRFSERGLAASDIERGDCECASRYRRMP